MKWLTILLTGLTITIVGSTVAQAQFREGHKAVTKSSIQKASIDQLLAPVPQNLEAEIIESRA